MLPNTTEGKDLHNIMANINFVRYAFVLIIMEKSPDAYDTKKKLHEVAIA